MLRHEVRGKPNIASTAAIVINKPLLTELAATYAMSHRTEIYFTSSSVVAE